MNKLAHERTGYHEDYGKISKTIQSALEASGETQKQNLLERLKWTIELQKRGVELGKAEGREAILSAESSYRWAQNQLKRLSIESEIAQMHQDASKESFNAALKNAASDQSKLEKAQDYMGKLGEIFKLQAKNYKVLRDTGLVQVKNLVLASSFAAIIEYTITKFLEFDKALAKFRIDMGLLREDSKRISEVIKTTAVNFALLGVTIEGAAAATTALANEFGGTMKVSADLVETTAILKAQLGVAEESTAGFLRNISTISKTTAQSNRQMAYLASSLTAAAGVPLNLVMQDVAKLSGNALIMVSRMPSEIIKTATAARVLGTTINKMADASRHILNFTENVQQEMEASVLIGENVNMQLARELAYRRDIAGSTEEILRLAKQVDFENLDVFQAEAFAAASGRSADELMKMVQAQRQLKEAKTIPALQQEVALYEKMSKARADSLKNTALQRELAVKQMANQERIAALTQQWNQLLLQATATFFPVIDLVLRLAGAILALGPALMPTVTIFGSLFGFLNGVFSVSSKVLKVWGSLTNSIAVAAFWGSSLTRGLAAGFSKIASIGSFFSKLAFLAPFAKAIPVIGWIITGLTFVSSLIKRISSGEGFGKALWGAFSDTFIKPFKDAWNWIKGIFIGHSPSELGIGIVRGIIGVEAMIFDALTSPFRRFLAWIVDKIPGMGGIAEKLRAGMTGALQETGVLEKKATIAETKPTTISTEAIPTTKTAGVSEPTAAVQQKADQDGATLVSILKSIEVLNANLMSGKIGIYMDGQLLSSTLSRQTAFKGGYGVNNVS